MILLKKYYTYLIILNLVSIDTSWGEVFSWDNFKTDNLNNPKKDEEDSKFVIRTTKKSDKLNKKSENEFKEEETSKNIQTSTHWEQEYSNKKLYENKNFTKNFYCDAIPVIGNLNISQTRKLINKALKNALYDSIKGERDEENLKKNMEKQDRVISSDKIIEIDFATMEISISTQVPHVTLCYPNHNFAAVCPKQNNPENIFQYKLDGCNLFEIKEITYPNNQYTRWNKMEKFGNFFALKIDFKDSSCQKYHKKSDFLRQHLAKPHVSIAKDVTSWGSQNKIRSRLEKFKKSLDEFFIDKDIELLSIKCRNSQ